MNKIEILSKAPAWNPPKREITLFYKTRGETFVRPMRVGRPTYFDEIIITQRRLDRQWPSGRPFARGTLKEFAKSSLRATRRTVKRRLAAVELPGPILDLRGLEPNNVAHILLNLVPLGVYAQNVVGKPVTCLFRRTVEPFRTLATKFGVNPVFIDGPVSGNFVKFSGTRGLAVHDLTTVFDCEAIDFFPDTYARFEPVVPSPLQTDRLFFARRGPRALLNHKAVEAFLTARGYTTVYFEDYSIDQQCALGAAARDVVAIHGAAMSYLLLAPRLTSIVEILPPQVYHQIFPVAFPQPIDQFKVVLPDFDPDLAYQPWPELMKLKNMAFEADLSLLEAAVSAK